jgi:hypothetical protein
MLEGVQRCVKDARPKWRRKGPQCGHVRLSALAMSLSIVSLAAFVAFTLAGCGSGSSTPSVPGGAVAKAGSGSPSYCSSLAKSHVLTSLGQTIAALANAKTSAVARNELRSAATVVVATDSLESPALHLASSAAAQALRSLAAHGVGDGTAVAKVATTFTALGARLEGVCKFPVG